MNTATAAVEQIPGLPPEPPAEEQVLTAPPVPTTPIAVVFVGDLLTQLQKRNPLHRLGGKFDPRLYTLPNRLVARGAITRLKKAYRGYPKAHIQKNEWGLWLSGYTLTNQWNKTKREFVNVQVGGTPSTSHLLFKEIAPIQEVNMLLRDRCGIIQVSADAGLNSAEEIKAAQLHYFPNWLDILRGEATIQERLRDLEDHIEKQRSLAQSASLRLVGDAYLQSCDEFRVWGTEYVKKQSDLIEELRGKGSIRYDEVAERLMQMLEITRKDSLVEGFARSQNDSASIQQQLVDLQKQNAEVNSQFMTAITLLAQNLNKDAKEVAAVVGAAEAQPPVPATKEEAEAELTRQVSEDTVDEVFVDMTSEAVADPLTDADVDEILDLESQLDGNE